MTSATSITAFVDFTIYGNAETLPANVDYEVEGRLHVGDIVMLTDYDLDPSPFGSSKY